MTEAASITEARGTVAPPFLLSTALIFWGWLSGYLIIGAVMGAALESARVIKLRWDLSDTDFRRIVNSCTLLTLATMLYVFSAGQETGAGVQGSSDAAGGAWKSPDCAPSPRFCDGSRCFCLCSSRRRRSAPAKKFR
jgi:hypothetical protein